MHQRRHAPSFVIALVSSLLIAACGGDDAASPTGTDRDPVEVIDAEPFPAERCDANRAAGTITFLTGFDYAAAASIIEVINADARGYFEEVCLDVEIVSSFSTANYPLVAGDRGQFASGGSFSEVLAFSMANEADLVAVYIAGHTPIDALMVKPGVATEVGDLAGTTIGVKGKLPASIEVMLLEAGLVNGTDYDTVPVDGFDPVAHMAIAGIDAVPGWKSNEPGRLEREGVPFVLFDPTTAAVPGSFGAIFTTRSFIDAHPTAAEDFLRATLLGLASAIEDPQSAAQAAVDLVIAGGNPNFLSPEGEMFRWATEAELIRTRAPQGRAPGTPDPEALGREVAAYQQLGFFGTSEAPGIADHVDAELAHRVSRPDGTIIWPAR